MLGPFPYDGKYRIAGSLTPADIPTLKEMGITLVVNAGPDHEVRGGLTSHELRHLLSQAGIMFADIPFTLAELTSGHVDTFLTVATPARKVLVACADGERSATLLAAADLKAGKLPGAVAEKASAAGFKLDDTIASLVLTREAA
ncbi:beta-lactamase hydrolase domain-containing protein [Parvularcula maris]|uniref:Sulfur transferase domain-containing protein n=1 Tax=Parvularcula maris TaxID=2965077 RepID=A0A9X2RJT0_9PROT|nr:sulfur transferase domain-containing protein [Parvularcula maris]MCQ8186226.1 sulfur transferase domain-containing protein [Parvularcula maris]